MNETPERGDSVWNESGAVIVRVFRREIDEGFLTDRTARSFKEIRRHTDEPNCSRDSTKGRPRPARRRAT